MKKKELKKLAQDIVLAEIVIKTSSDKAKINRAKEKVIDLSSKVSSLEEMMLIDDLVQEILKKSLT